MAPPPVAGEERLDSALFQLRDIASAVEAESALAARYGTDAPQDSSWFEVKRDTGAVLIVAPHATAHMREGDWKREDAGSGSLALALAGHTGSTVIHTSYRAPSDPNYYDANDFKRQLRELVDSLRPLVVLDIHTSHWRRAYDVDIGTMRGGSLHGREDLVTALTSALRREGVMNISRDKLAAAKNATVTKWVSTAGVPAMQLEINSVWLLFGKADEVQEHRFAQLLQALVRFVTSIKR